MRHETVMHTPRDGSFSPVPVDQVNAENPAHRDVASAKALIGSPVGPVESCQKERAGGETAPASCTVTWINLVGLASLMAASYFLPRWNFPGHINIILLLAAPALPIIVLEAI